MLCQQNMLSIFGFMRIFMTKKEKMAFLENINRYFILFRFGEDEKLFISTWWLCVRKLQNVFFGQESCEEVFSFFSRGWPLQQQLVPAY